MKNKIILGLSLILLCCGCEKTVDEKYTNKKAMDDFYIYVDSDTCLEYFVSYGGYNIGTVTPRYSKDGTIRQNRQCLRDKELEDEK